MKKTIALTIFILFSCIAFSQAKMSHADSVKTEQAAIQNTVTWIVNVTNDMKQSLRKNDALTADEYAVFLKGVTEYLKEKEKQFAKKP